MAVTRYSALSVSKLGSGDGLILRGGEQCLTDEADLTRYLDWLGYDSGGQPSFRVEFGQIPGLTPNSRLVLHIVGTAVYAATGGQPLDTSFFRLVPVWIACEATEFGSTLNVSGGLPALTGLAAGEVVHLCQPVGPYHNDNSTFNYSGNIAVQSNELSSGGFGGYYSFRLYGVYLTIHEGVELGDRLDGAPYVAFNMYNGGLVTVDSDGRELLSTGNSSSAGVNSFAAWFDGSVAMPYTYLKVPFGVLQPQGSEMYSMAQLSEDETSAYNDGNASHDFGDISLLPMEASATVMLVWASSFFSSTPKAHFWEFDRAGRFLNEWIPDVPAHSTTGDLSDNLFPQTGGRFKDKFIFNGAANGTANSRVGFTQGSGHHGGDVLCLDLATGQLRILITDEQIGLHAGAALGDPIYGESYLLSICLDPENGDIYMYVQDRGYDESRNNDAQFWISRWDINGNFLGKVGFTDDHMGGPYEWNIFSADGGGAITCCEDGRLIYFYAGNGPDIAEFGGDEYDGLLQLDKNLVPRDGSTVYMTPKPFWRSPTGTLEGIGGHVTKMMRMVLGSELNAVKVKFKFPRSY